MLVARIKILRYPILAGACDPGAQPRKEFVKPLIVAERWIDNVRGARKSDKRAKKITKRMEKIVV